MISPLPAILKPPPGVTHDQMVQDGQRRAIAQRARRRTAQDHAYGRHAQYPRYHCHDCQTARALALAWFTRCLADAFSPAPIPRGFTR